MIFSDQTDVAVPWFKVVSGPENEPEMEARS